MYARNISKLPCITLHATCALQAAWEVTTAWQARCAPSDLSAQGAASTAVIASLSFWDYSAMLPVGTESDAHKTSGRCFSVAAGRISYVHGFKGGHSPHQCIRGPPHASGLVAH